MATRALVTIAATAVMAGGCSVAVTGRAVPDPERPDPTKTVPTTNRPEPSEPSEMEQAVFTIAQTYVDALNRQDDPAIEAVTCAGETPTLHQIAHPTSTFAVEQPVRWNDRVGSGQVPLLIDGRPDTPLVVRREGGKLCAWG